jgi:hypothetical protein
MLNIQFVEEKTFGLEEEIYKYLMNVKKVILTGRRLEEHTKRLPWHMEINLVGWLVLGTIES